MTELRPIIELFCIRHGEAQSNVKPPDENTVGSDAPLTQKGKQQAQAVGRYLQRYAREGNPLPGLIWHSQLTRARQTAQIIADILGEDTKTAYRLQEMRKGAWEGDKAADIIPKEEDIPDGKKPYVRPPENDNSPPAENVLDVATRTATFVQELQKENVSSAILVSHNHPLEAMMGFLTNPEQEGNPHAWNIESLANGSITRIFKDTNGWHIDHNLYNLVPDSFDDN